MTATSVYDGDSDSIANLEGECTPSATGRLSDICNVLTAVLRNSTAVVLPPCDSTVATAASYHSTVIVVGSSVRAIVITAAGAPATRAAADRLWPRNFCCEMSVNVNILGKFSIYFLLR